MTSDRMLIHPTFTSTVYDDEMLLVVQTVEEKDPMDDVCILYAPPPDRRCCAFDLEEWLGAVDPAAIQ